MAAAKSLVSFPELQRDNFEEGNTGTEHFVWNADLRAPVKIDNVETDSKNDMETESKDDNDEDSDVENDDDESDTGTGGLLL